MKSKNFDSLHALDNWVVDLHKQIYLKDKMIEALQLNIIKKEQEMVRMQINNMVDKTCDTYDLMQTIDAPCDTNDLVYSR